ncbi:DUF5776 domain-containing protein [Levilactobacillus parabrevis]|uniref:DUF5776 domain-containing protein n=1 Tax=Levilactobacillus parabrevis TaxID=357278 RepID=UPI0021A826D5|nr:DUF5776 domain-containing protein [Levilactobacillus parabrevis]MCT4486557.1 BspA family leucine-rich repeat surface protein [Levilactobacillus parabrevis]MCT4489420.1 BspA family leucine-rich repeat surface protein [Levilactobacillus parabrevis]
MKWKLGLIALGVAVGLSPLFGYGNSRNNSEAGHNFTVALADETTSDETYSGIIGSGETSVPWTLEDGTLTLKGGTLPPFSGGLIQKLNGKLLYDLQQGNTDKLTVNDFKNKVSKIDISNTLTLSPDSSYLFAGFKNVTDYSNLKNIDASQVTDMSYMFYANSVLQTFTAPKFLDTNNHSLDHMFSSDGRLTYLDLSEIDSSHITSINNLTPGCSSLLVINLANFSSQNISSTGFSDIFDAADIVTDITLSPSIILNQTTVKEPNLSIGSFTGNWVDVGNGNVTLLSKTPSTLYYNLTDNYLYYDPKGSTSFDSTAALFAAYDGSDSTPSGNVHYVLEPSDTSRIPGPPPVTPIPTPNNPAPTEPDTATFQPFAVTATKKIGLYSSKDFSAASRLAWFVQKPQLKQPTFTVIGTTKSTAGNARYQVRDTTRGSATYGQTGYITTQSAYVTRTYYESAPEVVTVINPGGINGYDSAALKQPQKAYKQGTRLTVKKVVTHNATTRFLLTNGKYVSANKHFVTAGQYKVPTKVQAKTAVNRYATVNLTKKNKHYPKKAHAVFKVLGWDYSRGTSTTTAGTLRYRVAGGYITANPEYVKALN